MRSSVIFFVCLIVALSSAQLPPGFQDLLLIDDYTVITRNIIIQSDENTQFPVQQYAYTQDASILGGERDVTLIFLEGDQNIVISTGVANGNFQSSTPNQGSGRSACQYDGIDGTFELQTNGLGNLNFRANGGNSIRGAVQSDLPSTVTFSVYSGSVSAVCQYVLSVPGGDTTNDYIITFEQFTQNCDFSNVGAVEISCELLTNVDILINVFSVFGPIPSASPSPTPAPSPSNTPSSFPSASPTSTPAPSQSNTPAPSQSNTPAPSPSNTPSSAPSQSNTPTPAPSQSNTPTSAPSQSRTPAPSQSNTPAPSPSNTPSRTPSTSRLCICQCPAFTCEVFRLNQEYNFYNGFYGLPYYGNRIAKMFNL